MLATVRLKVSGLSFSPSCSCEHDILQTPEGVFYKFPKCSRELIRFWWLKVKVIVTLHPPNIQKLFAELYLCNGFICFM